ncbi:hypothetical protein GB937_005301 [Aspergillus fischeri]|nr:hypothetical protein GB937_005301 [Aspergillus fischeri]
MAQSNRNNFAISDKFSIGDGGCKILSPEITNSILTTIMDNSARTLHSITHSNTQGSNSSIPSSSVTLGYTPSAMAAQPQTILPSSTNQTQFGASAQQQQAQQKHNQTSSSTESANTAPPPPAADIYPHQVTGSGGPLATAPFLRDFSLVAEAAKRAQMSVVLRDLESVTL